MKFLTKVACIASVTALLLTGCTASPGAVTPEAGERVLFGGTPTITTPPEVLTVAYSGSPIISLDPNVAFLPHDCAALHLIAGTLFDFGSDGEPVPGLAESASASDDGLSYTFTLRPDLTFSDGTPLTSQDVKATLDRTIDDPTNVYGIFTKNFSGVDAPAADTVVLHLRTPDAHLLKLLMQPAFMIMPADRLADGPEFFRAPISAGPYMLENWDGGAESTYVVNPNYWGSSPVVPTVVLRAVPDYNTALAQLSTGEIDMAQGMPMSIRPQLEASSAWLLSEKYGFFALQLNNTRAPFDDPIVRQAISLAIDRDQLNTIVWGGLATPLSQFWPSTMDGYDPSISTTRDVETAQELIAGTACADGCSMEITANESDMQTAQIIAENLAEIGIDARVTQITFQAQIDNSNTLNYDANVTYIYDFVNIPTGLLEFAARPGGYFNGLWTGWDNANMNDAADRAIQLSGGAEKEAFAEVNRLFVEDAPYATLATLIDLWGTRIDPTIVSVNKANFIEVAREGQ